MERKKALALAAAVTGVLGSTTVAMAAVGGLSLLGFGGEHHTPLGTSATSPQSALAAARVVTRTKDVYDRVTVAGAAESTPNRFAGVASVVQPDLPIPEVAAPPRVAPRHPVVVKHRHKSKAPARSRPPIAATPRIGTPPTTSTTEPVEASPPITTTTTTTTTAPPVTTTTRPRGVPRDWPPGKPIPPMPPNCREPQLEDNGVWNCQG